MAAKLVSQLTPKSSPTRAGRVTKRQFSNNKNAPNNNNNAI